MSASLWLHGLQHARPPCPSPTPGACSNSCPSSRWCHPTISSSVVLFSSCLQSFPASGLDSHRARINIVNGITVLWQEPGTCLSNRQDREHGYQCARLITRRAKLREFPFVCIHFLNEIRSEVASWEGACSGGSGGRRQIWLESEEASTALNYMGEVYLVASGVFWGSWSWNRVRSIS